MLATLLAGATLAKPLDFYADGPYDPAVPRPESVLGYGAGERHTNFRDQERVDLAIADAAKDRVRILPYGKTPEGRPLRVFAISSPANIARLKSIQDAHAELAQGKGDPAKTVPIVWINECIHGDETASFEAGMWTLYNLAAARGGRLAKALDDAVVILNPVYNPDGHERYVVYYNSIATGSPDPAAYESRAPEVMLGRTNHYRFDMNRDRIAFSQDETRQEFPFMLSWGPQVYVDQHGQVGSYFFPPEPMSINLNVDRARNAKWTEIFGRATGQAFDAKGFTYFTRSEFDLYYPGYLDASTTLSGAIGMTHETDGGRYLAREQPDGSTLTLRQGMEKHFTSALTVVTTAAGHGRELLADYATFKRRAATGASAGKFQRVVMAGDPRALERLRKQLAYAGVASSFAAQAFTQGDAHDYWSNVIGSQTFSAGSLVVDLAQPQGAMAKALLEPGQNFEPEFVKAQMERQKAAPEGETYPGNESPEFYDLTGWSLPYAHNLRAWWCESAPAIRPGFVPNKTDVGKSPIGYALRYTDVDDALAAFEALAAGVRGSVTTQPMTLGGKSLPRGTFLFLAGRNEDDYEGKLFAAVRARGGTLEPLTTAYPDNDRFSPGSDSVISLRKPNVAIVMGGAGGDLADVGALWWTLERDWKLPFTPISQSALSGDLGRFTCIVIPPGASAPTTGRFREWISAGNVAIGLDAAGWAVGDGKYADLSAVKGDPKSLPGSLFRAEMDPRSFLSYGYEAGPTGKIPIAVPILGDGFFLARKEGGSVVTLSADEKANKLLSGWEWPDDTEVALRGTVFLQDTPVGRGHFVLYTGDPTQRAMWPGLSKTLIDAILIGSGR